ncbi:hypothetical protein LY78DRAFT_653004 [Colletotrichum sublineola]|nr:hypothetical protein LY78DRAFT_653004 [Colletotrichum sublineola]
MWWPLGVDGWNKAYGLHLEIWLKAMEQQENGAVFLNDVILLAYMRESWETGRL